MFDRTRASGLPPEYLPTLGSSPPSKMKWRSDIFTDNFAKKIAENNYHCLLESVSVLKKHVFSTSGTLKLDKLTGQINSVCGPAGDLILFKEGKVDEEPLECEVTLGGYVEQGFEVIEFHYNFEILYPACDDLSKMATNVLDVLDERFRMIDKDALSKKRAFVYSADFMECSYPHNNIGFARQGDFLGRKHISHRMEYLRLLEYMQFSRFCESSSTNRGKVIMCPFLKMI